MKCTNMAEQWVESGFHGKMVEIPCGMTGVEGIVVLCDECQDAQTKKYPQGWVHHPGDTCKHGVWLNPEHDCNCFKCEEGIPGPSIYRCHCGQHVEFTLGYEDEMECPRCDMLINLPTTQAQLEEWTAEINQEIEVAQYTGKLVIVRQDECGHISNVLTIDDDDAAQYTIAGVEAAYPESRVWVEKEVNMHYAVAQQMLDEGI